MARDVSPLRPARLGVRVQDLSRPALIRLIEDLQFRITQHEEKAWFFINPNH